MILQRGQITKHLGDLTQVWSEDGNILLYQYQLSATAGCTYLGTSSRVWLSPHLRGRGYGKTLHQERLQEALEKGFDVLLCTVNTHNKIEGKILSHFGWKVLLEVKDHGEYSTVIMYKRLRQGGEVLV